MTEKRVVGVVGEKGAGKETFAKYFQQIIYPQTLAVVRTGDVLRETLQLWGIPNTRTNLQDLAIIINGRFGQDALPKAVQGRIDAAKVDLVIMDGIRWRGDEELLRSYPSSLLVYVTADPRTRFQRLRARNEKSGEAKLIWKQFLSEEQVKTETLILQIGARADFKIVNNGSLPQLKAQVKKFVQLFSLS